MRTQLLSLSMLVTMSLGSAAATAGDLMSAYQQARSSDPQFRSAEAARLAAQEVKTQARAGFLPAVNLGASASKSEGESTVKSTGATIDSDSSSTGYSLSLTQPIYRRTTYVNNKIADAQIAQSEADYQNARQALILRLSEAYFGVLAAQDNLAFARAEKEAIARQLDQTKQRYEVGLIAITDVHESQAAYDSAVAAEIAAENRLNIARERLREITAVSITELSGLKTETPLVTPEPTDIEAWVKRALEQNLQLASLQQQVAVARQTVESARSGHYPTLDLTAQHRYFDEQKFTNTTLEDVTDTTIALQLNVPLYQGGATSSRVRQSRHQLTQAQEGYEQQRRLIERATRSAYLDVVAGISRVKALQQALVSSQSALEASEAGLEVGTRTTVDVLAARRELFRAQSNLAQARYDYILATLRLQDAAGMLDEEDVATVNAWLQ
ncbi:MAG: TolC family outer membrane protein [Pseudomonadota bacterium]